MTAQRLLLPPLALRPSAYIDVSPHPDWQKTGNTGAARHRRVQTIRRLDD